MLLLLLLLCVCVCVCVCACVKTVEYRNRIHQLIPLPTSKFEVNFLVVSETAGSPDSHEIPKENRGSLAGFETRVSRQ